MMLRPEVSLHLPLVSTGEFGPDGYEYPWIEKIVEWLQEHPAESEAFEFDNSESEPTGDDPAGDSWGEVFLLYDVADEAVAVAVAKAAALLPGVPRGGYVVVNHDPETTDTRTGRRIEIEEG
jgi:hypothetical protein